jgi:amino acid transporter
MLILASRESGNFARVAAMPTFPYGLSGVLTAVATSGIVLSFNGFQSPLNLAGESRNPARDIPFALIGSVVLGAITYVLLQFAYVVVITPAHLAQGWAHVNFSSPFAQLAMALNLNWLALMLYVDAFVSPSGAGITDMATTTRMVLGMQQNGFAPAFLGKISPAVGIPRPSLCFNLLVCFVFLFCFRGWGLLAATISVATAISYLMIPICAMSLRRTSPELPRPVRAPVLNLLGSSAFVVAGELLYWARWPLTAQVILLTIVVLPIYGWYRRHSSLDLLKMEFRSAFWLILYLPCIALLSWLGSSEFGGRGFLPYGWDMSVVGVVYYVFSVWGTRSALRNPPTSELLKRD